MGNISMYIAPVIMLLFLNSCASVTPLMDAAKRGDINMVKDLLNKGAQVNETGSYNSTALHEAIEAGQIEVAKYLIDHGADINAGDSFGETPLLYAALNGHSDIVKLLIDKGANVSARNYQGWTALAYVSKVDIAKMLADKGADVNVKNNYGSTPLSSAAMNGRTEIIRFLLERGADLDIALVKCEQTIQEWSTLAYMKDRMHQPRGCVDTLKKIKNEREEARRQEQEIAKAKIIEAQKANEIKDIIKAALAETSKIQKNESQAAPVASDIEKPEIPDADKIFGDNDLAVIIGIEGYNLIPKSEYSFDDAKLVKEYFKALGIKERNIEFLGDEKATKSAIEKSIEGWLFNKAKPGSRVFIYYSGHGAPEPATGDAYIVPYDGDPNYLSFTGYPLKRLYEKLSALPAGEVTVILDACFSGTGGRSVLAKGARPLVMSVGALPVSTNMAVLTATQGTQISTSSTERGHGIFTYYFLKAIKDGKKDIAEIYEYIKPLVEDEAKGLNVQQSPSVIPDLEKLKGRFGLRK